MKRRSLGLLAGMILCGCAGVRQPAVTRAPKHGPDAPPHWTYTGTHGPEHWSEIDPSYAACNTGRNQSPVDLSGTVGRDLANIEFHYQPSSVHLTNNGHTVLVNFAAGGYLEVDGRRYEVLQSHYHAPSEHTLSGQSFDAELHIVHQDSDGQNAVVGILLREGADNPGYGPLRFLPEQTGGEADPAIRIDPTDFLPSLRTTIRYTGSLTTPPCTEGVRWMVMTTPVEVSAAQIAALERVIEGNNRPVQPLNDRVLVRDESP